MSEPKDVGWFSVQRRVFPRNPKSEFYGDGVMQGIWATIIAWANWDDAAVPLPAQGFPLQRGQLVTSIRELASATGFPKGQVERRLLKLVEAGRITIASGKYNGEQNGNKSRKHGTLITVVKYGTYQSAADETGNKTGNRTGNRTGLSEQELTRGTTEQHNPPCKGALDSVSDRDRAKATTARLVTAFSGGRVGLLSAEDRGVLLAAYGTVAAFERAMAAVWRRTDIGSHAAYARTVVVDTILPVIDSPPAASGADEPAEIAYRSNAGRRACWKCTGSTRAIETAGKWDVWCALCDLAGQGPSYDAALGGFHALRPEDPCDAET